MYVSKAVALSAKRLQEQKLIIFPLRQLHNAAKKIQPHSCQPLE